MQRRIGKIRKILLLYRIGKKGIEGKNKSQGKLAFGFLKLEVFILENNELDEIKMILTESKNIRYNPFSKIPLDQLEKALELLEEFSAEIQPDIKEP